MTPQPHSSVALPSVSVTRREGRLVRLALAGLLALTACAGDDGDADGAGTISSGLRLIPEEALDAARRGSDPSVIVADVAAAADAAGLDAPAAGRDVDDVIGWWLDLTVPPPAGERRDLVLTIPLPQQPPLFDPIGLEAAEELVGIDPGAVESVAAVTGLPDAFLVVTGPHEPSSGLESIGGGVLSLGSGEDGEISLDGLEEIRPLSRIGAPVRVGARDGAVALSSSTPAVEDWLAGERTAADDDDLAAVAAALDAAGAVGAWIQEGDFTARGVLGAFASEEQIAELEPALEEPFDVIGMAVAVVDGEPRYLATYLFDDDAAAVASADPLAEVWTGAELLSEPGTTIGEFFGLETVDVSGRTVTVALTDRTATGINRLVGLLFRGEVVFLHG